MITRKHTVLVALGVCAIALAAMGSVKNPVTRPVKIQGYVVVHVDPVSLEASLVDTGVGTHAGKYYNTGSGVMAPDFSAFVSGGGRVFAANGDYIDWEFTTGGTKYIDGSGRFEGITGGFTITPTFEKSYMEDGELVLEFSYVGVGQIRY